MSDVTSIVITLLIFMFALIGGGLWISLALVVSGVFALAVFSPAPVGTLLSGTLWDASHNWTLTALPMFIWMGEILFQSRLSESIFSGLRPWVKWLPGQLLHVNIAGSAVMAAVSGSSAVTCATIGRMSIPELRKLGYEEKMIIGSLTGAGTLGLLIPPSIQMIVYGVIANQSIAQLFIAGIVPGLLLVSMFSGYIIIYSCIFVSKTQDDNIDQSFLEKIKDSLQILPIMLLIVLVIGSIYGGYATPTEAATLGVVGALGLSYFNRSMSRKIFFQGLLGAVRTSSMIGFIIVAASFLSVAVGFLQIPQTFGMWINSMDLSRPLLLVAIAIFYIFLGCFFDGISMLLLTASVILPMVENEGINMVWFGIFLVVLVETAQITPPLGFNLYVVQSLTGRKISEIVLAAVPFFVAMLILLVIISACPSIVTILPMHMVR